MIVKVLSENTALSARFGHEHGLSLGIETTEGLLLFDTGATDLFIKNAHALDFKLEDVKLAVLSHGHYDHGGGLKAFADYNETAPIYASRYIFGDYYSIRPAGKKYIGLDKTLASSGRFIFVNNQLQISNKLSLFSSVEGSYPEPSGNKKLFEIDSNGKMTADRFRHEANLVVHEHDKYILVAGCAHKGILNIIERFAQLYGCMPDYVISGFHLYNRHDDSSESQKHIDQIGRFMLENEIGCYTGHCTGLKPYRQLKEIMGNSLEYIAAGSVINLLNC